MPTDIGKPFDIKWRGDPAQMLPGDIPLWYKFLEIYKHHFIRLYYNVRVGGPDVSKITGDEALKRMWYLNTAKRIDVIAERTNDLWIIEVASSPYLRAVGQCLTYKFLWQEDPKITKPVAVVLICPYLDADLEKILRHYGVYICKIGEDEKIEFRPMPEL